MDQGLRKKMKEGKIAREISCHCDK